MKIQLIAVGTRMPKWVESGYDEYAKRLNAACRLTLTEIPASSRRRGGDTERAMLEEGERMLSLMPASAWAVALELSGQSWSTPQLASRIEAWMGQGRPVALLVGGADGLDAQVRRRSDESWSLSPLTFPHPLVRIIVAEQLYRACSLLQGHPYHR